MRKKWIKILQKGHDMENNKIRVYKGFKIKVKFKTSNKQLIIINNLIRINNLSKCKISQKSCNKLMKHKVDLRKK